MKKISGFIFTVILFSSCSEKGIDRFKWIEGNWKGHDQEIQYFENWKKTADDVLSGESFVYQNGDTVYREKNKIEMIGETPCYMLSLPETKEPVIFKMTGQYGQKIVFENKEHDFPQVITYEMTADSLHVYSTGTHDKQKVREEAYFHKK